MRLIGREKGDTDTDTQVIIHVACILQRIQSSDVDF